MNEKPDNGAPAADSPFNPEMQKVLIERQELIQQKHEKWWSERMKDSEDFRTDIHDLNKKVPPLSWTIGAFIGLFLTIAASLGIFTWWLYQAKKAVSEPLNEIQTNLVVFRSALTNFQHDVSNASNMLQQVQTANSQFTNLFAGLIAAGKSLPAHNSNMQESIAGVNRTLNIFSETSSNLAASVTSFTTNLADIQLRSDAYRSLLSNQSNILRSVFEDSVALRSATTTLTQIVRIQEERFVASTNMIDKMTNAVHSIAELQNGLSNEVTNVRNSASNLLAQANLLPDLISSSKKAAGEVDTAQQHLLTSKSNLDLILKGAQVVSLTLQSSVSNADSTLQILKTNATDLSAHNQEHNSLLGSFRLVNSNLWAVSTNAISMSASLNSNLGDLSNRYVRASSIQTLLLASSSNIVEATARTGSNSVFLASLSIPMQSNVTVLSQASRMLSSLVATNQPVFSHLNSNIYMFSNALPLLLVHTTNLGKVTSLLGQMGSEGSNLTASLRNTAQSFEKEVFALSNSVINLGPSQRDFNELVVVARHQSDAQSNLLASTSRAFQESSNVLATLSSNSALISLVATSLSGTLEKVSKSGADVTALTLALRDGERSLSNSAARITDFTTRGESNMASLRATDLDFGRIQVQASSNAVRLARVVSDFTNAATRLQEATRILSEGSVSFTNNGQLLANSVLVIGASTNGLAAAGGALLTGSNAVKQAEALLTQTRTELGGLLADLKTRSSELNAVLVFGAHTGGQLSNLVSTMKLPSEDSGRLAENTSNKCSTRTGACKRVIDCYERCGTRHKSNGRRHKGVDGIANNTLECRHSTEQPDSRWGY